MSTTKPGRVSFFLQHLPGEKIAKPGKTTGYNKNATNKH